MSEKGMRHRYFIADKGTPLVNRMKELHAARCAATKDLLAFVKDIGASEMYGSSPATYVFDFKCSGDADQKTWRKTPPRRGTYYFTPRKNTPEGKAMAARIKALPECPRMADALKTVPELPVGFPCVISGGTGYSPFLRYYNLDKPLAIVSIPWRDHDEAEIEKYKAENAAGTHYSASMDYAQWTPPEWLTEIKEWQALKIIDEAELAKDTP